MPTHLPTRRAARSIADGYSFLESPRWREGELFASDFFSRRVLAFSESGEERTVCEVPGQPSGIGWMPDGSMLVVSMLDRKVLRYAEDRFDIHADLGELASWHCNDMTVDPQGRAYVGNFGWDESADDDIRPTSLHLVDADGTVTEVATDLVFPNGMAISDDGGTFYVAETFAARISAFDRAVDGSLSNRRTWASFSEREHSSLSELCASGLPLPDGICLDAEGAIWMGDAGGRGAMRVAEGGEILAEVATGEQAAYAVALGGEAEPQLFVCAAAAYRQGDPEQARQARLLVSAAEAPRAGPS